MLITEHTSPALLDDLLKARLPPDLTEIIRLHLSYCVKCKELCEELALKEAIDRMWDAYDRSGKLEGQHVEAEVFKRFWKGEIQDEELLEQISLHCIVCRRCRHKRRNSILAMNYVKLLQLVGLLSFVGFIAGRHRRLIYSSILLIMLGGAVAIYNLKTPKPQTQGSSDEHAELTNRPPEIKAPGINNEARPAPPSKNPIISGIPKRGKQHSLDLRQRNQELSALITRAEEIDLSLYETGSENRGVDTDNKEEPIEVRASRVHLTALPIKLPEGSKRGWYIVKIKDPFLKRTFQKEKAWSDDGRHLTVILDMRNLSQINYYLSIKPEGESGDIYRESYPISISHSSERGP